MVVMSISGKPKQKTLFQTWSRSIEVTTQKSHPDKCGISKNTIRASACSDNGTVIDLCFSDDGDDDAMLSAALDASMAQMGRRSTSSYQTVAVVSNAGRCTGFDRDSGDIWIYPTNYPKRDYQFNIVKNCLFANTMVSLPTGLGKTFIAAVVMYNFFRWYPTGKIVFMAPTKPLVAQQIEACYNIMGIPQKYTVEMTGSISPGERRKAWREKRVFFLTPQVLINDLGRGSCPADLVRCLVVDEAHKALGNHAYCQVIRELSKCENDFRVLALSATPGSDIKSVQQVIENLHISHIELRTEEALDISPYIQQRTVEKIVVPLGKELTDIRDQYIRVLSVYTSRLTMKKLLYSRPVTSFSKFMILKSRDDFRQNPPTHIPPSNFGMIEADFALCMSLYHGYELLQLHGIRSLYNFLLTIAAGQKHYGRMKVELERNADFMKLFDKLQKKFSDVISETLHPGLTQATPAPVTPTTRPLVTGHPKMDKLVDIIVDHFTNYPTKCNQAEQTRVMIFCQYRDCVNEITQLINHYQPLVKAMSFIGQSSVNHAAKGFTQKEQLKVMKRFREGGYNTLVSTCVGEEGLDIGDVDLIVCFDAHKSPVRLVQRMGRTGRKRDGRIVMLVTEGKEEQIYNQSQYSKKSINKAILNGTKNLKFYEFSKRMVPSDLQPACHQMNIVVTERTTIECSRPKKTKPASSKIRATNIDSYEPEVAPFSNETDVVQDAPVGIKHFCVPIEKIKFDAGGAGVGNINKLAQKDKCENERFMKDACDKNSVKCSFAGSDGTARQRKKRKRNSSIRTVMDICDDDDNDSDDFIAENRALLKNDAFDEDCIIIETEMPERRKSENGEVENSTVVNVKNTLYAEQNVRLNKFFRLLNTVPELIELPDNLVVDISQLDVENVVNEWHCEWGDVIPPKQTVGADVSGINKISGQLNGYVDPVCVNKETSKLMCVDDNNESNGNKISTKTSSVHNWNNVESDNCGLEQETVIGREVITNVEETSIDAPTGSEVLTREGSLLRTSPNCASKFNQNDYKCHDLGVVLDPTVPFLHYSTEHKKDRVEPQKTSCAEAPLKQTKDSSDFSFEDGSFLLTAIKTPECLGKSRLSVECTSEKKSTHDVCHSQITFTQAMAEVHGIGDTPRKGHGAKRMRSLTNLKPFSSRHIETSFDGCAVQHVNENLSLRDTRDNSFSEKLNINRVVNSFVNKAIESETNLRLAELNEFEVNESNDSPLERKESDLGNSLGNGVPIEKYRQPLDKTEIVLNSMPHELTDSNDSDDAERPNFDLMFDWGEDIIPPSPTSTQPFSALNSVSSHANSIQSEFTKGTSLCENLTGNTAPCSEINIRNDAGHAAETTKTPISTVAANFDAEGGRISESRKTSLNIGIQDCPDVTRFDAKDKLNVKNQTIDGNLRFSEDLFAKYQNLVSSDEDDLVDSTGNFAIDMDWMIQYSNGIHQQDVDSRDSGEKNASGVYERNEGDLAEKNACNVSVKNAGDPCEGNVVDPGESNAGDLCEKSASDLCDANESDLEKLNAADPDESNAADHVERNTYPQDTVVEKEDVKSVCKSKSRGDVSDLNDGEESKNSQHKENFEEKGDWKSKYKDDIIDNEDDFCFWMSSLNQNHPAQSTPKASRHSGLGGYSGLSLAGHEEVSQASPQRIPSDRVVANFDVDDDDDVIMVKKKRPAFVLLDSPSPLRNTTYTAKSTKPFDRRRKAARKLPRSPSPHSDSDFQDVSTNRSPGLSTPKKKASIKAKRNNRAFADEEAVESSDDDARKSSDETDDSDLDKLEASFIDDATQCTQQTQAGDLQGVYLRSVKSPRVVAGRYKLQYKHRDVDVFSQSEPDCEGCEESQYQQDSFCCDDDDDGVECEQETTEDETYHERPSPQRRSSKRKRIIECDSSMDEESEETLSTACGTKANAVRDGVGQGHSADRGETLEGRLRDRSREQINDLGTNGIAKTFVESENERFSNRVEDCGNGGWDRILNENCVILPQSTSKIGESCKRTSDVLHHGVSSKFVPTAVVPPHVVYTYDGKRQRIDNSATAIAEKSMVQNDDPLNERDKRLARKRQLQEEFRKHHQTSLQLQTSVHSQPINSSDKDGLASDILDSLVRSNQKHDMAPSSFTSSTNISHLVGKPRTKSDPPSTSLLLRTNSPNVHSNPTPGYDNSPEGKRAEDRRCISKLEDDVTTGSCNRESDNGVIFVDSREISSAQEIISGLRREHGLSVYTRKLPGCDYIVSDRLGVERLLWSFFAKAANHSKVLDLVRVMCDTYERQAVIIERDRRKKDAKSHQNQQMSQYVGHMLTQLSQTTVCVYFTDNQEETCTLLSDLCATEKRKGYHVNVSPELTPHKEQMMKALTSVPSMSYVTALNLTWRFITLSHLIRSSVGVLQERGAMTKKRAMALYSYLHRRFTS